MIGRVVGKASLCKRGQMIRLTFKILWHPLLALKKGHLNIKLRNLQLHFFSNSKLWHSFTIYWILHLLPIKKELCIRINFSFKLKARAVNAGSRLQKKFLNKIQKLGPRCRTVHFCGRYAWDLEVNSMHPSFKLDLSEILLGRDKTFLQI